MIKTKNPTPNAAYGGDVLTSLNNGKEITGPSPDPFAQRIDFDSLTNNSELSSYGLRDNPKGQHRSFSQHLHLAKLHPKKCPWHLSCREEMYSCGYQKYLLKGPRQESIPGSPGKTSLEDESPTPRFIQEKPCPRALQAHKTKIPL